jgi:hypothetical protein
MEVATVRLYVSEKCKKDGYIFLSLCILQAQRACHTSKNVENFQTNSLIHSINTTNKYPTKYHKFLHFLKRLDYGKDSSELHIFTTTEREREREKEREREREREHNVNQNTPIHSKT